MITKEIAATLSYRSELYSLTSSDSKGYPHRSRVNGALKTWKRDAARWELPMKFGLRDSFTLQPWNADQWTTDLDEANERASKRKETDRVRNAARIAALKA